MKLMHLTFSLLMAGATLMASCNNAAKEKESAEREDSLSNNAGENVSVKEEEVSYAVDGTNLKGYIAYDEKATGKRPVVLVVPEWWGLTEYPRMRAKQLAQMGYLAMAVDMYGEGKIAADPKEAQNSATPFYSNPAMAQARLNAALAKALSLPQADSSKTAAIGYCFGGTMVLNAAALGSNFDGVVSFHGGLEGIPAPKSKPAARILVCHGAADNFVPEAQVAAFKKTMDSVGADYSFKTYANATHAFTNPDATKKGEEFNMPIRYNGAADTASWNDMKAFFQTIFK